jgi:two-component system sensor histidine kinase YesM
MSESLAELFQYSMKNMQHPVSLQEEVDHVLNYMKIQQHRFSDRFICRKDISVELSEVLVLKLTIQPLVENAVNHGFEQVKSGGYIDIRAYKQEDHVIIEVEDNGKGIEEMKLLSLQRSLVSPNQIGLLEDKKHGIGLLNIQQRIRLFYGDKYGISIHSMPGKGTRVRMELPFRVHLDFEGDVQG